MTEGSSYYAKLMSKEAGVSPVDHHRAEVEKDRIARMAEASGEVAVAVTLESSKSEDSESTLETI